MRIVRISDMTDDERKGWEEEKKQKEIERQKQQEEETRRANELFNQAVKNQNTIQSNDWQNNANESSWFHHSNQFNNGYQFGDVTKTVIGSAADVGLNLTKGIMGIGEGIGDAAQYGIAAIQEARGDKEKAEKTRESAKFNAVDSFFKPGKNEIDKLSVFGDKSDSMIQSLGYTAGMAALSTVTGGAGATIGMNATTAATVGSTAAIFTSSFGNGVTDALNDGANSKEAAIYGAISGAGEALSELMSGGLGKFSNAIGFSKGAGEVDDLIAKSLTKNVKNNIVKTLIQGGIKATGEGLEEVVSGFISGVGQKLTYMKDEDFQKILKDQKLGEQFLMGAATSAILQGPDIIKSQANHTDYITGYTNNEQKIYDEELSNRISEQTKTKSIENAYNEQIQLQEKLGVNLTEVDKANIRQAIEEAYQSGNIQDNTKLSGKEYSKIEEKLKQDFEEGNITPDRIREIIGENQDINNDRFIQRSYYEEQQKGTSYQVNKTNNEKVNILYQSAADAGLNNTTKTRNKVDLIAKLTTDTDRQYKFVSPEQLKQMGYNENANGLIDKSTGEILINSQSNKGLQSIIGHETTHIFDTSTKSNNNEKSYTKEYQTLQDTAIEYAKTKGIYEQKVKSLIDTYQKNGITLTESEVKEELTADLVGDYLFNDEEFITKLTTNKNVFQKIYDYIKHIYNMATAGTDEAKQLEELKYKFDKAYQTLNNENIDTKEGTKYSLLSKEAYEGRQRYVDKKNADNRENAIDVTDEQLDVIEEITKMRHEIHASDSLFNSESSDNQAQSDFLMTINDKLKENGLPEIDFPVDTNDLSDLTTDIDVYELGEDYDTAYDTFNKQKEEINKAIEKYLSEFDKKHNTNYTPTGKTRYSISENKNNEYNENIVVPNDTDVSLKQQLSDKGLNILEYDPNIEGDRQAKIDSLDNLKFRLTNDTAITGDDIAVKDLQKTATIEDSIGTTQETEKTITPTVEDVLNQTPEEKQQGIKDKAKKYVSRSKTKFINKIVNDFGTSKLANTNTLNEVIDNIKQDIQQNGSLNQEKIDNYFDTLYNNLKVIDTEYYDQYKNVKDEIRKTKLYVSEDIRNDITDFNEFRKNNMGTIVMTNDSNNVSVDSYYQELSTMHPELFPSDITNPTNQLERIAEVQKDISKVEMNVSAYADKNLAPEYREWARHEFDNDVNKFTQDIKLADRYNNAVDTKFQYNENKDTVKQAYAAIPQAKRAYEKVLAKEVLTKEDKIQVDRILNNEIQMQDIPNGMNKKGIINVVNAKYEYDTLQKICKDYSNKIKESRYKQAEDVFGNPDEWKDKKHGFEYSTETAIRNIIDIAPNKEAAKKVNDTYFKPISKNETTKVKYLNNLYDEVKNFNIGTKNKYQVTYEATNPDGKQEMVTKKVSESTLVQLLGENKITADDVKKSGADIARIQSIVDYARKTYNVLFEQINETRLQNGYAPVAYRKDYFPHFTESKPDTFLGEIAKEMNFDISNKQELPTNINGKTDQFKPGTTWFGNILQRTTDKTDYNFLKGFEKYTTGAADIIYHTDDLQRLRALATTIRGIYDNTEFQNKVQEIKESNMTDIEKSDAINELKEHMENNTNLGNFVKWLDNYTNLLANKKSKSDRLIEDFLNRHMYTIGKQYESRIASNAIGGNVSVALTNFGPIAQSIGEINPLYLLDSTGKVIKDTIKQDTSFADKCDFYVRRQGVDKLNKTALDKITEPINNILAFPDQFTTQVILRAKYTQNLHEGMSIDEALQNANDYTAGLMADRSKGALPTAFNNQNPVAKMFNMFQVEVNNQWRYYTKDLPQNMKEKAEGNKAKVIANTAMAYTKIMFGSYLFNELLGKIRGNSTRVLPDPIYIIKELIKGLSDDDKDNDDDTFISTISEIAGNMPFASLPATLFADSLGLDAGDIGRIPISGAIPNIKNIITDISDMVNGNQTTQQGLGDIGKELADTIGAYTILPYGGSQLKKTITGLNMYKNEVPGNYTDNGDLRYTVDDNVGSKIQAGLFGAYANPYASDYIDSGFKSIKKDNIDEMVGLDMNSTEYRQYKKELNTSTKTEDKLKYINSLDLTPEQKTIAANNINKNSKNTIDMKEYNKYGSYDEYKYARDNPEKYSVISQITDYDTYISYANNIKNIAKSYSTEGATNKQKQQISVDKKQAIQQYINSLDLDIPQKMMLEKEAGGYSIKNYANTIKEYLDSLDIVDREKYNIWNELFE